MNLQSFQEWSQSYIKTGQGRWTWTGSEKHFSIIWLRHQPLDVGSIWRSVYYPLLFSKVHKHAPLYIANRTIPSLIYILPTEFMKQLKYSENNSLSDPYKTEFSWTKLYWSEDLDCFMKKCVDSNNPEMFSAIQVL